MKTQRKLNLAVAVLAILAACGSSDGADTTTTSAGTTIPAESTTIPPTTTTVPATTTSVLAGLGAPEEYPVSDDYVVETVIVDLDAAAGGLAIDDEGNLYTADFGYTGHDGNTVFKVAPDGMAAPFATHATMGQLTGNTFGSDGFIYQSSYGTGHVYRISLDGEVEVLTDQMVGPTGIVLTEDGRLIVDDCSRNAIYEVFDDGTVEEFAGGLEYGMRCPNGLVQDPDGNFYVVNFNNGLLTRISPDGSVISDLHNFPGGNAHIAYHDGGLFLTARQTHRVFRYDLDTGEVVVVAGTGTEGYDDGPGSSASFGRPNAIVVDSEGNLYINHGSDSGNNPTAIRAIRPVR